MFPVRYPKGDRSLISASLLAILSLSTSLAAQERQDWNNLGRIRPGEKVSLSAPDHRHVTGAPGKNSAHDARCYDIIFEGEFPDTRFISGGSASDVQSDGLALAAGIKAIASGCMVTRLVDRDDHARQDVQKLQSQGLRVLSRRHIECFLWRVNRAEQPQLPKSVDLGPHHRRAHLLSIAVPLFTRNPNLRRKSRSARTRSATAPPIFLDTYEMLRT